jgi:hypothetical protein
MQQQGIPQCRGQRRGYSLFDSSITFSGQSSSTPCFEVSAALFWLKKMKNNKEYKWGAAAWFRN